MLATLALLPVGASLFILFLLPNVVNLRPAHPVVGFSTSSPGYLAGSLVVECAPPLALFASLLAIGDAGATKAYWWASAMAILLALAITLDVLLLSSRLQVYWLIGVAIFACPTIPALGSLAYAVVTRKRVSSQPMPSKQPLPAPLDELWP